MRTCVIIVVYWKQKSFTQRSSQNHNASHLLGCFLFFFVHSVCVYVIVFYSRWRSIFYRKCFCWIKEKKILENGETIGFGHSHTPYTKQNHMQSDREMHALKNEILRLKWIRIWMTSSVGDGRYKIQQMQNRMNCKCESKTAAIIIMYILATSMFRWLKRALHSHMRFNFYDSPVCFRFHVRLICLHVCH